MADKLILEGDDDSIEELPVKKKQKLVKTSKKPSRKRILEEEVTIKLHPKRIVKGLLIVALIFAIFFLGYFSAAAGSCSSDAAVVEEPVEGKSEKNDSSWLSSLLGGLLSETSSEGTSANATVVEEEEEETESESEDLVEDTTPEPDPEPVEDETVVTSYSKVTLEVNQVYKKWMGTWGKITGFQITIKNNEAGTIKPDHLTLVVEGYGEDSTKEISILPKYKELKAGSTSTFSVNMPNGFAYSEVTAGDLTNVELTLALVDGEEKEISKKGKVEDLSS